MANTIDVAFIKQFESEVHMAYQRMGSKLGTLCAWQTMTGSMLDSKRSVLALLHQVTQRKRHPMELVHTSRSTMEDFTLLSTSTS